MTVQSSSSPAAGGDLSKSGKSRKGKPEAAPAPSAPRLEPARDPEADLWVAIGSVQPGVVKKPLRLAVVRSPHSKDAGGVVLGPKQLAEISHALAGLIELLDVAHVLHELLSCWEELRAGGITTEAWSDATTLDEHFEEVDRDRVNLAIATTLKAVRRSAWSTIGLLPDGWRVEKALASAGT